MRATILARDETLGTPNTELVKVARQEELRHLPADFLRKTMRYVVGGALVALPVDYHRPHRFSPYVSLLPV